MTRLEIAAKVLPEYIRLCGGEASVAVSASFNASDALLAAAGEPMIHVSEQRLRDVLNDWFIIHENQLDDLINQLKDGK